jgi:sulfate permease, SulP family
MLPYWLPGALLGLMIFVVTLRIRNPLTLPLLLALGGLSFFGVAAAVGVPISQLRAQGWLLGSMPSGSSLLFPFSPPVLNQVDWTVLAGQIPNLLPAAIISVIALLLNCGGLELMIKRDIDLNRELTLAGVGNLVVGLMGGLVGFHTISFSALNRKSGGGRRLTAVVAALCLLATVFLGASFISYIPKIVFGAVLVYLGASLLYEWVYEAWFKFPRIEFAIISSILGVVIFSGFLTGVIVGLVLAIILFVVSYSRVNVVRFALSSREYRSRVTRSLQEQQVLDTQGERIYILKLQGFIFFGTANRIFDRVRSGMRPAMAGARRYIVMDFALVSGLDSTGLLSFTRMLQWAREQNAVFVLTGLKGRSHEQFANAGFAEQPGSLYFVADLDRGIEWCENDILAAALVGGSSRVDLVNQLRPVAGDDLGLEKLILQMQRYEYAPGDYVIRQGDDADQIYFVESGQVTAQLEVPGQLPMRLETMGGGRCVGELAFYLGIKRTAAVVAVQPSVLYGLSMNGLAEIERTDPQAAGLFHRIVVRLLGERVRHLTRVVDALVR